MTRAPKGSVMAAVLQALTDGPWQTMREVEDLLGYRHPELARTFQRLLDAGKVKRRVGARRFNAYEWAVK